ncbi:hypothetical protein CROQUDRAFT_134314 [Cronartium quercuum f. sp. fusiforme G11]|uniref:Uncharacterized protein n=1 Tax=Cronartium quercuum f. sp. fusiforme G11 TaxID=708437 RepID=A0A9P6NJ86_9BASI|nr:hypothetical protein CROQUDRAFT_134314 [Cronartium quercuum f. sp. fusiforme G11]
MSMLTRKTALWSKGSKRCVHIQKWYLIRIAVPTFVFSIHSLSSVPNTKITVQNLLHSQHVLASTSDPDQLVKQGHTKLSEALMEPVTETSLSCVKNICMTKKGSFFQFSKLLRANFLSLWKTLEHIGPWKKIEDSRPEGIPGDDDHVAVQELVDEEKVSKYLEKYEDVKTAFKESCGVTQRIMSKLIGGNNEARTSASSELTVLVQGDAMGLDIKTCAVVSIIERLAQTNELSLYDAANLYWSLSEILKNHLFFVKNACNIKIKDLSSKLHSYCHRHPDSAKVLWGGKHYSENFHIIDLLDPILSLLKPNYEDVMKQFNSGGELRNIYWTISQSAENEMIYKTNTEFENSSAGDIEFLLGQIFKALHLENHGPYRLEVTVIDQLNLIKTLFIIKQTITKHKEWDTIEVNLALESCEKVLAQNESKFFWHVAPKKLAKAYFYIKYALDEKSNLDPYEWNEKYDGLVLRMSKHQDILPKNNQPTKVTQFIDSASTIKAIDELLKKIEKIGTKDSEFPSFEDVAKSHSHIRGLLQWLAMKKYGNDHTDFLIQSSILKKAIEYHTAVQTKGSRELCEALRGRIDALYPVQPIEQHHHGEESVFQNAHS